MANGEIAQRVSDGVGWDRWRFQVYLQSEWLQAKALPNRDGTRESGDGQPSVCMRVDLDTWKTKKHSQGSVEHTAAVASKCQSMADPCVFKRIVRIRVEQGE